MLRLVLQSLKKPTHQGVCSHTTDTIASAGAVSSLTVLAPVLEHVVKQLDDIRNLRLTARLFRYHPAIVWGCEFAWIDDDLSLQQGKAAISLASALYRGAYHLTPRKKALKKKGTLPGVVESSPRGTFSGLRQAILLAASAPGERCWAVTQFTAKQQSAQPVRFKVAGSRVSNREASSTSNSIWFLQRLPRLQKLHLEKPKTLLGLQSLTQLQLLELAECQQFTLDMSILASLQQLQELRLMQCRAVQLMNLSKLTGLTRLKSQPETGQR